MITRVKNVGVFVKDQEKALDFYTNKLGFEVLVNEDWGGGKRWIEVAPKGAETRLSLFTPEGMEEQIGSFSRVVFMCDDVRATYEEMKSRGVTFTQELSEESWSAWAQFVDPDGNTFVIASEKG